MYAIDTETTLILPGLLAPPLVCVSWFRENEGDVLHRTDPKAREYVLRALDEGMVGLNVAFDLAVVAVEWPDLLPRIFEALDAGRIRDLMIDEMLLDLADGCFRFIEDEDGNIRARNYSLYALTDRYLSFKLEKDTWRLRYHDLYDVPVSEWPEDAFRYSYLDAATTYHIWLRQKERPGYRRFVTEGDGPRQVRAAFALHLTSMAGLRTDEDGLQNLENRTKQQIDEVLPLLRQHGLVRADGRRDTKAAVRRMIAVRGYDVNITTSGEEQIALNGWNASTFLSVAAEHGKWVSVNAESCENSGDEVLRAYATYTQCSSLLTGTIKDFRRGLSVPIQTRYHSLMATGRTSSSGPNIQNLRRVPGVRECFVPRPGNVFIACDYSSAELHTLAQTCIDLFGFSKLGEALNTGRDVHLWVGSMLGNMTYEEAEAGKKAGDKRVKELRQLAKAANFGFPGGCAPTTFTHYAKAYGLQLTVREAAKIKSVWMQTWTEMRLFFDHVTTSEWEQDTRWFYTFLPRSNRLRARCSYTAACNTYFQGLCADGAKAALYQVAKECFIDTNSALYGCRPVAFIHDEIIVEAPEGKAHEAAMRLQYVMETEFNKFVPDCPTQAEPALMRRWSKAAEPVFDADGRLIPWEDKNGRQEVRPG